MSEEDFLANPDAEYFRNLEAAEGMRPDLIADAAGDFTKIVQEVANRVESAYAKIGNDHDEWSGDSGDQHREELLSLKNYVHGCVEPIQGYGRAVHDFAEATTEAKSAIESSMQCTPDSNPTEQTRIPARALQKLFYNVGTPVAAELTYPGKEPETASAADRGETPDGATAPTAGASPGGAPASPVGAAGSKGSVSTPQTDAGGEDADPPSVDGKSSDSGASAPSGGSPSGSGGGSPTGGSPSGAASRAGAGGDPAGASASPSAGAAGFDPGEAHTSAMSASDYTPVGSLGAGGYGGVGTLGEHERALTGKYGAAGIRPSVTSLNVNTPGAAGGPGTGGMGGALAPGAMGGKQGEKEHKTPDYLKNDDHGRALFGGALPTATPEVIGELTQNELVKMAEEAKERDGQARRQPGPPPSLPDVSGGPQPRRKGGAQ